jgi:hypothetical protein
MLHPLLVSFSISVESISPIGLTLAGVPEKPTAQQSLALRQVTPASPLTWPGAVGLETAPHARRGPGVALAATLDVGVTAALSEAPLATWVGMPAVPVGLDCPQPEPTVASASPTAAEMPHAIGVRPPRRC